ncbi:MAG: PorT family protein [Prevotella sp.]|nr:PorT family protein [Prevotella sp.]
MRRFLAFITVVMLFSGIKAQERTVENKPYIDLRPFHFGVLVGTHLQDMELQNVGPQLITNEDGTTVEKLVTCDQDRWDAGFTVGVLGEVRLGNHFAFRVAPAMYFGTRHFTFLNHTDHLEDGTPITMQQEMKSAYISTACDLIFSAKRFNNHRPYLMAGVNPMMNLSGSDDDIIRLKRFDCYLEIGMGCDFYLPFFKLRPELKFGYSLTSALDSKHAQELKDKNMLLYTNAVKSDNSRTKFIALTFYFE